MDTYSPSNKAGSRSPDERDPGARGARERLGISVQPQCGGRVEPCDGCGLPRRSRSSKLYLVDMCCLACLRTAAVLASVGWFVNAERKGDFHGLVSINQKVLQGVGVVPCQNSVQYYAQAYVRLGPMLRSFGFGDCHRCGDTAPIEVRPAGLIFRSVFLQLRITMLPECSIRRSLWTLVLVVTLPLATMLAVGLRLEHLEEVERAHATAGAVAQIAALQTEHLLDEAMAALTIISERPLVQSIDPRHCDPFLTDFIEVHPQFTNIGVTTQGGDVVCSAMSSRRNGPTSVRSLPWWLPVTSASAPVVSEPFVGPWSNRWVSAVAYPLRDAAGAFRGALWVSIDLARFQSSLEEVGTPTGFTVTIATNNGIITARSMEAENWIGRSLTERGAQLPVGMSGGPLEGSDADGVERLRALTTVPATGWRVTADIPKDVALAPARTKALWESMVALLGIAVVGGLASLLRRRVERPVERLAAAAAAAAEGDLSTRLALEGPKEIAEVGRQLNRLLVNRQEVEDALRQSETRFATAFNVNPLPVCLAVADTGRFIDVNEQFVELTGYTRDELIGHTSLELGLWANPDDRKRLVAMLDTTSTRQVIPSQLRPRSGMIREVESTFVSVTLGGERCVLSLIQDVTERKRMEEALEQARVQSEMERKRLQAVLEILPVGVVIADTAGNILETNAATRGIWGEDFPVDSDAAQFGALSGQVVVTGERITPREWPLLRALFRGETVANEEIVIATCGGTRKTLLASAVPVRGERGAIVNAVSVEVDITERKRREEALRSNEAQLAGIIDSAMDAIISMDQNQQIVVFNRAAEGMFRCTADEVLGQTLDRFIPEPYRDRHGRHIASFGRSGVQRRPLKAASKLQAQRATGELFPIEASISQVTVDDRPIYTVIMRDITERKQLEAQLVQSQKMESVGQLAGGIAHDFNNLLMGIMGYTQLALQQVSPESELAADLEEIAKASDRAAALTHQLLAFARKQVIEPRVTTLNQLLLDLDKLLRRLMGAGIELVTRPNGSGGRVRVDPGQIEQVLVNLAVNARDAMPHGGRLTIMTEQLVLRRDDPRLPFDLEPGNYLALRVTDTGVGMDETIRARIFEPFFTTKEPGKGTGLGLATCYGIVKQHGGHIAVDSVVGEGSTFHIYLPLVVEQHDDPADAMDLDAEAVRAGSETILLVEDEPQVRTLTARVLTRYGYRVLMAANGLEALELVRAQREEIALLLTDVVMPQMGGVALAREIEALCPNLKIVFMSGYTGQAAPLPDELAPSTFFIQKPFVPTVLGRKLREMLDAKASHVPM